jgi:hypothetical protein
MLCNLNQTYHYYVIFLNMGFQNCIRLRMIYIYWTKHVALLGTQNLLYGM